MAVCVKCKSPIPESAFGIYTCGSCQSVLAIDFDGNITLSEDKLNRLGTAEEELAPEKTISLAASKTNNDSGEFSQNNNFSAPNFGENQSIGVVPSLGNESVGEEEKEEFQQDDRPPYELDPAAKPSAEPNFDDVIVFANSELSQGTKGAFLYDVLVKGIDSEDLRIAVKEALIDKRFGWDSDAIMRRIRGGSIKIEKINSVKASILISRLKGYPLEITWVQNGLLEVNP